MPFNKKYFNYTYYEQMVDIVPSFLLAVVMYLLITIFESLNSTWNLYILFGMEILIGVVFYIVFSVVLRNKNLIYIINLLKLRT